MLFQDRTHAGRLLARLLAKKAEAFELPRPVVLGLARGGVPVAFEIARRLEAPLDVVVVRKVGTPQDPEYALGAVTEEGVVWIDYAAVDRAGVDERRVRAWASREEAEIPPRMERYRDGRPPLSLLGRTAILVDDGLATGATALAAAALCRKRGAERVVVAVPVAARASLSRFVALGIEVYALQAPARFGSVGAYYEDFAQTEDREVESAISQSQLHFRKESA